MIAHKSEDRISLSKVIEILEDPDVISEFQQRQQKTYQKKVGLLKFAEKLFRFQLCCNKKKRRGSNKINKYLISLL